MDARSLGLDCMEWIFELEDFRDNPLWSDTGRRAMRQIARSSGVAVSSICADYIMLCRLTDPDRDARTANVRVLQQLVQYAAELDIGRIVLPLLEESEIGAPALQDQAYESISACLEQAMQCGVIFALEMDVPGGEFAAFVQRFHSDGVRALYDTGNSTAQGLNIGSDVVSVLGVLGAVHVKDRTIGGTSQPFGSGDANLPGFFDRIVDVGFTGDLILEPYFGTDPMADAVRNLAYVRAQLARIAEVRE